MSRFFCTGAENLPKKSCLYFQADMSHIFALLFRLFLSHYAELFMLNPTIIDKALQRILTTKAVGCIIGSTNYYEVIS